MMSRFSSDTLYYAKSECKRLNLRVRQSGESRGLTRRWIPLLDRMFGVNYFFCLTTIISPDQRQLLLTSSAGAKRHRGAGGAARACLFCSFLRREKRRRWESGKPALGFPLFHPPSRRSCGNVGISPLWARFPRGSWEAWETCFWFSTLSTAPPFPQLSSRWIWPGGQFTPLPLPPGLRPAVSSWPPPLDSSECSVQ